MSSQPESPVVEQPASSVESPAVEQQQPTSTTSASAPREASSSQQQQDGMNASRHSSTAGGARPENNNFDDDGTNTSVPLQPVTVFNDPPAAPAPQHPDYLGDLFQDVVASASLPAPFEGWTDLLSLPDSVLLSRLGGDGLPSSTKTGSVSSLISAGSLPGEVLTHPSRVLLRVLHRLSAEFRFLQMRQIDESDMIATQKKESQNSMIEQMRKDNIAKIKGLLAAGQQPQQDSPPSSSRNKNPYAASQSGYDEMLAQTAITNLEKRLFSQQQKVARPRASAGISLSAAGSYSRTPQINENQRLKTYWRARYQQACVELEEIEQQIALTSQELFEFDKVAGCHTNDQLKDMIERCRVAEETAHAFAETCRIEMKRAEIAAGRNNNNNSNSNNISQSQQQQPSQRSRGDSFLSSSGNRGNSGSNAGVGGVSPSIPLQSQLEDSNTTNNNASMAGNESFASPTSTNNNNISGMNQSPAATANTGAPAAMSEHELALLPFLVDSLSQHAPQAIHHAVSIRLKTQELQQIEREYEQERELVERLEHAVEKAHNDYATAVGRLPSHISINFESVIKSHAQLEAAEDALFDAQQNLTQERMQFTRQRHEATVNIERERCKLMEQKEKIRRDLRSSHLDMLRIERKRKDQPTNPITAKDFTSVSNTMNFKSSSSVTATSGGVNNNNNSMTSSMPKQDNDVADAASHLETMRARVKIYELERQSLLLDAMRAGTVPRPE